MIYYYFINKGELNLIRALNNKLLFIKIFNNLIINYHFDKYKLTKKK